MNRKSNRSKVTTGTEIVPCPSSSKKTSKRRSEITCDDELDLVKDGSWRWAIEKVFFYLLLVGNAFFQSELKEAQNLLMCMYYVVPSGKRLRSMVEAEMYNSSYDVAVNPISWIVSEQRLALWWGRNSTPEAVTTADG
ncbi:unnamed protein product [Fraxinus pennsylvanica]|uniref:Uncharacterized protein n=1 Tax=Fraxinus pennsylvanica TaxID=56036 RepID=A0AAD1ZX70_9LAMI|nr:unnamed protein product [Fraxinus pennsylvanica]